MRGVVLEGKNIPYAERSIESRLSQIGAKVARATESLRRARAQGEDADRLLLEVQRGVADLYEMLGDVLQEPPAEGGGG